MGDANHRVRKPLRRAEVLGPQGLWHPKATSQQLPELVDNPSKERATCLGFTPERELPRR